MHLTIHEIFLTSSHDHVHNIFCERYEKIFYDKLKTKKMNFKQQKKRRKKTLMNNNKNNDEKH